MKNILFILFVSVFVLKQSFYAQNKTMDSLNLALKNAKHDTTRLIIYLALCEECELQDNLKYTEPGLKLANSLLQGLKNEKAKKSLLRKKAIFYSCRTAYYQQNGDSSNQRRWLFIELENYKQLNDTNEIFSKYLNISAYYFDYGNTPIAIKYFDKAIQFAKQMNNKKLVSYGNFQMGQMFLQSNNFENAKTYFLKANQMSEELKDTNIFIWGTRKIAECYSGLHDTSTALKYFKKAIGLSTNQPIGMTRIFQEIGDNYKFNSDYEKAILYYKKSLLMAKKTNFKRVYFTILNRIGNTYRDAGNYDSSLVYINKSNQKEIIEQSENSNALFWTEYSLAKTYYAKKDYPAAKKHFDKVYQTAQIKVDRSYSVEIELAASILDSVFGNHKSSLAHYKKYIYLRDKFNSEDLSKQASKDSFQEQFEKQKLEAKAEQDIKDKSAKEEQQQQQFIIFTVALILLIVLIFSALLFKRFRLTNKQKGIIEQQKHLVEEKHKEITDSINYAERIQKTFLASNDLLNQHLHNYFILFKPKDVVSGDFYWADTLPNGNFVLATADSTGHGVPGAIMSLLNITSLEKAIEHLSDPAEILNHTRQTIIKRLKRDGSAEGGKDGMDCSLIIFDIKNKQLHIAAANNPVWIVRGNELIEIKADKMPVGKHDRDQESFTSHSIQINEGDIIYTLTDGFPDQFGGEKGKKFMSKNLKELLTSNSHLSMNEQKELLNQTFNKWVGNLEQVDDVTLIGIKI
jgi:serine phosphatase RsbU (regulator of sigma subunit)